MGWDERARAWLQVDPDPDTRAELEDLLARGADLAPRFAGRLEFGTAGLRGELGAGPLRMNRVVVRQTTAGLAARLAQDGPPATTIVTVGRDARHKSDVFAADVAGVLAQAGFDVRFWAAPVPTPLLAYATRLLGAGAGVQITASHNPARDNGYKVYWRGGGQITPPLDGQIAQAIAQTPTPVDVPAVAGRPLPDDIVDAYRAAVLELPPHPEERALGIVYTPLHGVAGALAVDVLRRSGFGDVAVVDEQFAPDPDFPTVAFPNPEEPGALDAAMGLAARRDADLVLANDPDGDRVAAAVPTGAGWRLLTGDEIGSLLADYLLEQQPGGPERVVATTVVSSQMLRRIAAAHDVGYTETLTGLKWLAAAADRAAAGGRRMVLAYEEALGVMIGDVVRDKDGISAALVLADAAAFERARGRSLLDRLDDLARRFGVHAKAQTYVRYDPGADVAADALARLRDRTPAEIAGTPVHAVDDHVAGVRRTTDGRATPLEVPRTDLVGLRLADGSRLQIRPSGTEPKLKFYLEVVEPAGDDVAAARDRAQDRLAAVTDAFLDAAGIADDLRAGMPA
ncbi:MAG TPA: phospho-sugar mutase [Euzebyales bacterium]|nr:phospho-sugar mutase [Euzebyales bacterium]